MGTTYITAVVTGPTGKKATVRFLIDSGASYTLLPENVWKRLGLKPKRTEHQLAARRPAVASPTRVPIEPSITSGCSPALRSPTLAQHSVVADCVKDRDIQWRGACLVPSPSPQSPVPRLTLTLTSTLASALT
jgi:hypothetical protein